MPGCWRSTNRWSARTARRGKLAGRLGRLPGEARRAAGAGEAKALFPAAGGRARLAVWRWHREAKRALGSGHELLANERYAVHLAALGGVTKIERAVERIERAAVLDHRRRGSWRRARPWTTVSGRPAGTASSCGAQESLRPAVAELYRIQDGAVKAFVKNELAMREKMSGPGSTAGQDEDAARGVPAGTRSHCDRRPPVVQQENYGAWRFRAERAVGNAKSMLADEKELAPFFKENPGLRQTLAAWRPLDRTMREEDEGWERIKRERAEQKRLEQRRDRSRGISM